jgi:protocatechuate 3,4-dioxygenase beta subunit
MMYFLPVVWLGLTIGRAPIEPLSGVVVDPEEQPAAGADVWLAGPPWGSAARILAHAITDRAGRFTLDRPAAAMGPAKPVAPALWALRPGWRLGVKVLAGPPPRRGEPVRVAIGPPAREVIRVVGPDLEPVPGARVRPVQVHLRLPWPPVPVRDRLAATTDREGRADLEGLRPEDVAQIEVAAEGFGSQRASYLPPSADDKTIRLRGAGRLSGRLVCDRPAAVRGWSITARILVDDQGGWSWALSEVELTSDDQGRFEVPAIAAGRLSLTLQAPAGSSDWAEPSPTETIRAGQVTRIEVPVRRAVRVEGTIREHGTGAPVSGVKVGVSSLAPGGVNEYPVSDDQGRYSCTMPPGTIRYLVLETPRSHFLPPLYPHWADVEIKAGPTPHRLPPIELRTAATIPGLVLDDAGRPVAGAFVSGEWNSEEFGGSPQRSFDTTDGGGRFVLGSIAPGSPVRVRASLLLDPAAESAIETATATAAADAGRVLRLRLRRQPTVALRGRILGPGGHPVAGALVRILMKDRNDRFSEGALFWFEDDREIRTGGDGSFRTTAVLPAGRRYRAEVIASGLETGRSDWVVAPRTELPDLTLRPAPHFRAIAGRVLDRRGGPVAGAEVFPRGAGPDRDRVRTDLQGRFRLAGIPDGPTLLFVRKEGFRFQGRRVAAGADRAEILVARRDEPAPGLHASAPLARSEERALGRKVLEPALPGLLTTTSGLERENGLLALARLDPRRVLDLIEDQVLGAGSVPPLRAAVLGLAEDDPRAAIETVDSDRDPQARALAYLDLAEATPGADGVRRRDLLGRALREARRLGERRQQVLLLTQVALRGFDLGEGELATAAVRAAQDAARDLPAGGFLYPRGELAVVLARVDLPAALALLAGEREDRHSSPQSYDQAHARIAEEIARTDPPEAERLLGLVRDASTREAAIPRVCVRMAVADLPRARRLADRLDDPTRRAWMAGWMAAARGAADPDGARGLLAESFDRLDGLAESAQRPGVGLDIAPMMAGLLPIAERIDPDRLPEYLWRSLAALAPGPFLDGSDLIADALLAMLIAPYDGDAAGDLFATAARRLPEAVARNPWFDLGRFFTAATICDPRAAVALLDRLPEIRADGGQDRRRPARIAVATMLGLPVAERRRAALKSLGLLGPLDRRIRYDHFG